MTDKDDPLKDLQLLLDAVGKGMADAKAGRFDSADEALRKLKAEYQKNKDAEGKKSA